MSIEDKDPSLRAIHVSIGYDRRLWREDLDGSRAHAQMLGERGILEDEEVEAIREGLDRIEEEIEEGTFPFREEDEDIHMNVERRLIEIVGPVGGKLHTGRSRNDQVATDLRLWTLRRLPEIADDLAELGAVLLRTARRELLRGTVLPFYTHLQRAQPVLLAHHLLAHVEALERDRGRLEDARDRTAASPLGAGAGAGSGFPVDPDRTAELLGFDRPCRNSLDAVAARDFCAEVLSALAILQTHLSRVAQELILWSSQEFGFCTLSDAVTTGSSIMPQKRNPDGAELVRAKAGRVAGRLGGLLATLKGLPLAYNKDLQEDKEALFEAVDTVRRSLRITAASIREATFHPERMRAAATDPAGYAHATELADHLAGRGMPFREAHEACRTLVEEARAEGKRLEELGLERIREVAPAAGDDVLDALSVGSALARRAAPMGTAPARVGEALEEAADRWGVELPDTPS